MFDTLTLIIWAAVTVFKAAIFLLTFRGKYPTFRIYVGTSLLNSLTLWGCAAYAAWDAYYWVYYIGTIFEAMLLTGVVFWIVTLLFRPFDILPVPVFRTLTLSHIFVLAGTLMLGVWFHHSLHYPPLKIAERLSLVALLGGIVLTAYFARTLQIPWRNRASWIALGLVVYLSVSVVNPSQMLAYLLAEVCWLTGFILPETQLIRPSLTQLQELTQLAESLLPPKKNIASIRESEQKENARWA